MAKQPLISPLRYPGSKRRLVKYIKKALEQNSVHPKVYVEPFIGGGSVALQLMQDGEIEKVVLMDLDPWVASFWQAVFFDTDWLIQRIEETKVTLDLWHEYKNSNPQTTREKAWVCFYLNRTSFSCILEGKVEPLGGRRQASEYKIDCRFPKDTLIKRVLGERYLNEDEQVFFYFKFPPAFKIDFPRVIGDYNPDWGIARYSGPDKKIILELVRETKGTQKVENL